MTTIKIICNYIMLTGLHATLQRYCALLCPVCNEIIKDQKLHLRKDLSQAECEYFTFI